MRKAVLFTIFLLLLGIFPAQMQESPPRVEISNSAQHDFTSEVNGHDYRLSVALPDSYATSDETYPVLYVLDPQFTFLIVTDLSRDVAWAGELPEIIVVGVGYPTDNIDEITPPRERDYSFAQDDFIEVLSSEIMPLIDSSYRTNVEDRALLGYQLGGNFVFHLLVVQPEMFNRYAIINGGAAELMPYLMRNDTAFWGRFAELDIRLVLAARGTETVGAALQARAYPGLTTASISLETATAATTLHSALPPVVLALFAA